MKTNVLQGSGRQIERGRKRERERGREERETEREGRGGERLLE